MKLYGTTTSPYVRRVRIVAAELGEPVDLIDTASEEGQKALRAVTPIWKVPVAELAGQLVLDSSVIIAALVHARGWGPLRPPRPEERWREANLHNIIDGALDALINVFYVGKDGVTAASSAYLTKQMERAAAAMAWLDDALAGPFFSDEARLGTTEIALITALEWMQFRGTYDLEQHEGLVAFLAAHRDCPSVISTRPA